MNIDLSISAPSSLNRIVLVAICKQKMAIQIRTSLAEPETGETFVPHKPVRPDNPYDFTTTVTMGPHLARLPEDLRRRFAEAVLELEDDPLVLNYVRLNIDARRA